jgi:prepilin-type N-terminal cleavage/methylation domain-containing protein
MRVRVASGAGFTLVEVMVAIAILLVGVLGAVALIDGANRTTRQTKNREGATNVAREVIEALHAVPWGSLTNQTVLGQLALQPSLADADASKPGLQLSRRGATYTVSVSVCTVDDPSDSVGASDDPSTFCAPVPTLPGGQTADSNPNDYKRATVTVSWTDVTATRQVTQATTVSGNYSGPGVAFVGPPAVGGWTSPVTSTAVTSLPFSVTTTDPVDPTKGGKVDWLLNGQDQGAASGSSTSWSFTWPLGVATGGAAGSSGCNPSGPQTALDGTYFVGAQAWDGSSLSQGPQSYTVVLNRCPPLAPANLTAGQSTALSTMDVNWNPNPERDVIGYHVYRNTGSGYTAITCGTSSTLITGSECLDSPGVSNPSYKVVAVDRDPSGAVREGDASTVSVSASNRPPGVPAPFDPGLYGYPQYTLAWQATTDPDGGSDVTDFYWVYRDGKLYSKRWDSVDNSASVNVGGTLYVPWVDPDPSGGPHTYYVTAVDTLGAESNFSAGVTK